MYLAKGSWCASVNWICICGDQNSSHHIFHRCPNKAMYKLYLDAQWWEASVGSFPSGCTTDYHWLVRVAIQICVELGKIMWNLWSFFCVLFFNFSNRYPDCPKRYIFIDFLSLYVHASKICCISSCKKMLITLRFQWCSSSAVDSSKTLELEKEIENVNELLCHPSK